MALPALAQVSDLASWVGRVIPDADPRAQAVLSHASNRVRAYVRPSTWVDENGALAEVPDIVRDVVVRVAARVWLNPEELDSVTLDDGTKRWGEVRGLALTEADREDLDQFCSASSLPSGIGTVSTYRGDADYGDTLYVPTGPPPSGYPFPWYSADDPLVQ